MDLVLIHDDETCSPAAACTSELARDDHSQDRIGYVHLGASDPDTTVPLVSIARSGRRAALVRTPARTPRCRVRLDYDSALLAAVDALQHGDPAYARPPYRRPDRVAAALLVSGGEVPADWGRPEVDSLGVELFWGRHWPVFAIAVGAAAASARAADVLHRIATYTRGRYYAATATGDVLDFCADVVSRLRGASHG